ncbi:rhodanese-like domain-containing protein [Halioxenophilus sp. WMMB6]|uniref:rhodanese-like domain-containing protein n=1 Tax=Halioxenophilus sp. WMMB6 TaxID=3073815 RepID=UPI00295E9AAB|nr:rhodanese-like domain-containing protein [Halioxenophilus sp. WMMB6]
MTNFVAFATEQWLLVSLLLALVILYFWNEKRRSGNSVSTHEATRLLNNDQAVLVDLRDSGDFKAGHISEAINIPYAKLKDRLAELAKHQSKTVILTDKMGQHTGAAGRELVKLGYQVARLEGGMAEWQAQKLPVVK